MMIMIMIMIMMMKHIHIYIYIYIYHIACLYIRKQGDLMATARRNRAKKKKMSPAQSCVLNV